MPLITINIIALSFIIVSAAPEPDHGIAQCRRITPIPVRPTIPILPTPTPTPTLPNLPTPKIPTLPNPPTPELPDRGSGTGGGGPPPPFDEEAYLEDVWISMAIAESIKDTIIIIFTADDRLRVRAMQDLLVRLARIHIDNVTSQAQSLLAAQLAQSEAERKRIEKSLLGFFRWQTKAELRQNIESIQQTEVEVKSLTKRAHVKARALHFSPSGNWQSRGRIQVNLGNAYGQLNHISISGVGFD